MRVAGGYERYRSTPLISSTLDETLRDSARFAQAVVRFDTIDDSNFPRRGYVLEAGASSLHYSGAIDDPVQTYQVGLLAPVTFGRLTLLGIANAARSRDDRGGFTLGGLFDLSGTPVGAVS